ncbi:MAG TPA: ATP-binding protein [Micromonosporaceae bacterium]|jgi:hypothetical protein|nr:ATP-binding protein [Micromonosporaceae bacterium]
MDAAASWDQRVLAAEIARVRALWTEDSTGGTDQGDVRAEALEATGRAPALDRVVDGFGLTPFERDILLVAIAEELDPHGFSGELGLPVTFGQAMARLPGAHWSATVPDRPLRAARLVMLGEGPLAAAPLRADERIVHYVQGAGQLDERLRPYVIRLGDPVGPLPPSRERAAAVLSRMWGRGAVVLYGPDAQDRADVVAIAAAGRTGWRVAAADLPRAPTERDALARLWNREVVLDGPVLVVELADDDPPEVRGGVDALLRRLIGDVVVSTVDARVPGPVVATLALHRPDRDEQRALWRQVLPGQPAVRELAAAALAREFDLGHHQILGAPAELEASGIGTDPVAAARSRSRRLVRVAMAGLADRIDPRARFADLVLPPASLGLLRQLAAAATGRVMLAERGFGRYTSRGLGVTALFAGPSGTGKTIAAEAVAAELGLDLHRIDLATVVSKWVGETEKQLRRVFDAAECGGTVLLFDEADALFGRRSEVRDSHDRYANIEVAYLLQRMEQYRGVAILTTNLRSSIDPAFLRRLRLVVQFPHPDAAQRAALWNQAFPAAVPTEGLDRSALAALDLTGGDIRTIAMQAALVAAAEGGPVRMSHLRDAVAAEYGKHNRPLDGLGAWG